MPSPVTILGFSSFSNVSKYTFHLSLIWFSSVSTDPSWSFICLIWVMSFVALLQALAILNIFSSPSCVPSFAYTLSHALVFAIAMAHWASHFASLYSSLSSSLPEESHFFFRNFFCLTTCWTSSFHHHVSLSAGAFFPDVFPGTSSAALRSILLFTYHNSWTPSVCFQFSRNFV